MRDGLRPAGAVYDVAVVGSGPGGAACALSAARVGLSVALFEPQIELGGKPCGEGLMPPGVDALRALGLTDVIATGRSFDRLRYVLGSRAPLEFALPRTGLAVERPRLALSLDAAVASEPRIRRIRARARTEQRASREGCELHFGGHVARARVLVAADGLHGQAAEWLRGPRFEGPSDPRPRIGVRARYLAREPLEHVEVRFGRGQEVYLTPLAEGRVNVAVLVRDRAAGGAQAILERALRSDATLGARLGERITEPEARRLGSTAPRTVAEEATILVGDACGGIDPILGCGVTLALESGILAAQAARAIVDGDTSGRVEHRYVEALARRTRARRRLAAFLLALSEHGGLARGTIGLARLVPGLVDALVGVAAGGTHPVPIRLAAG